MIESISFDKSQNIIFENTPMLSICIPTYNRCEELKSSLLNSIEVLRSLPEHKIELIVSDNGSSDETRNIMSVIQSENTDIQTVFIFNKQNEGFDKNYLQSIKHANGRYVWVVGDDDIFDVNSIQSIISKCLDGYDYIVFDGVGIDRYGKEVNFRLKEKFTSNVKVNEWEGDFDSFFGLYGWHSTWISVNVMRRSLLVKEINNLDCFIGLQFIHLPLMARSFYTCKVKVLNEIIVRDPPMYKPYASKYENIYNYFCNNLCGIVDMLVLQNKISNKSAKHFLLGHSKTFSMFSLSFFLSNIDNGVSLSHLVNNFNKIKRVSTSPYILIFIMLFPKGLLSKLINEAKRFKRQIRK
ncbi:glycosyltransferase family 2 protein [Aeromonas veronii]|uniref:glycosyltransferase family 2 protein n=1 Tax=Aeromonas veronii TaxID=654 RepID=UPI003B9FECC1